MARITVTQLKYAVLDPKWRQRWLAGQQPSTFSFSPPGSVRVFGTRFHQETEQLARWLTSREHIREAAAIDTAEGLLDVLWRKSLQEFTDELLASEKTEEALDFTARVRAYCRRLIELRNRTRKFENWQDVFAFAEENIGDVRVPVGSRSVAIVGRVDAVRFHPKHELEIVDYKLSQGSQQKLDLVQIAIYSKLLNLWRPGIRFCGTLEYYLPDFMEVIVSGEELTDIFAGLVEPVLNEMFGHSRNASTSSTTLNSAHSGERTSTDDLATKVVATFAEFNLNVESMGVVQGPQIQRIKLRPAPGVKFASLANRAEDIRVALALDSAPLIEPGKGFVSIDLPREDRETLLLADYLRQRKAGKSKVVTKFPVGLGIEGEALIADFADSSTCHVLVAGTSGSGKSEWLKTLVASLALTNSPQAVRFSLVDPKILTFGGMRDSPYFWRPVATTMETAVAVLRDAATEMESRYQKLADEGHVNLAERINAGLTDLPFIIIVLDEFADLILAGREEKKEFEQTVARIAGKGRAAGIHLVLATQRPDRTVVTGLVKSNLPMKVCLKVTSATNSQIVLGENGGETLLGKGDLLCDAGKGISRVQSYYIPQGEFLNALKA
jgi:S-DNA-T family DNA segregation ATPase FtsK/SpoIIIE